MSLTLEPEGNGYRLREVDENGSVGEMFLTDETVLTLAQSALKLRAAVLAKRSSPASHPVSVTRVGQIGLNHDALLPEVHLTLRAEDGTEQTFSVPLTLAKNLLEALPRHIAETEQDQSQHGRA
jgi:hypothetical protein